MVATIKSSRVGVNAVKLAFHDADTDTDTDILAAILARMSVSASVSVSWNASLITLNVERV